MGSSQRFRPCRAAGNTCAGGSASSPAAFGSPLAVGVGKSGAGTVGLALGNLNAGEPLQCHRHLVTPHQCLVVSHRWMAMGPRGLGRGCCCATHWDHCGLEAGAALDTSIPIRGFPVDHTLGRDLAVGAEILASGSHSANPSGGPSVCGWVGSPLSAGAVGSGSQFSVEEIRWMFLHEMAHLRRCDLWLNWVLEAVRAFHWFNPVVGWVLRRWREDREEACDIHALSADGVHPVPYGRVLLKCLEGSAIGGGNTVAVGWQGGHPLYLRPSRTASNPSPDFGRGDGPG